MRRCSQPDGARTGAHRAERIENTATEPARSVPPPARTVSRRLDLRLERLHQARQALRLRQALVITVRRELLADPLVCAHRVDATRGADLLCEQLACLQVELPL